jgi:hypothetical protein
MAEPTTHIAGLDLQMGSWVRQRCAWCGVILTEADLEAMPEDAVIKLIPAGLPVEVTVGNFSTTFRLLGEEATENGFKVPENCCMKLPVDLTRSVEGMEPR